MKVVAADTVYTVYGWTNDMDALGEYTLKIRKTPEELTKERELRKRTQGTYRINDMRYEANTVIHKGDDETVANFLPGIWPKIRDYLNKKGVDYEYEDLRNPAIRPEPDYSVLEGIDLREQQDVALAIVATTDCGIIETSTGWGKSFLISLICKAFPTLNIVVTTSSSTVVATLYEYLCKQLPGQIGYLYARGNTTHGKRVVVTTLKSLSNISPENVHMVLCDECHNVGATQSGNDMMRFCFARRFGFSASPVRNDGSRIVMESLFGPVVLKMTYQESVDAGMVTPMKYTMLYCNSAPAICRKEGMPEFLMKRWSYWCNRARNQAIQSFVYDTKAVYDGQMLIMVASLEHAIQLHQLLPWFVVLHYGATDLKEMGEKFPAEKYPNVDMKHYKLSQKQLDIGRRAFSKGTLRYVISTTVMRQGVNFPDLAVLIRGDGAVSSIEGIQIPGRLSRLAEDKQFAYLVDIEDTFSAWAQRRALARVKTYQEQGWIPATREEVIRDLGDTSTGSTSGDAGGTCP